MSSGIYCLYSNEDGDPRYVGRTADKVSDSFKQHIAAALEKEGGTLYDWMREVWRQGFDVGVHTLQEGIDPADLDMYEQYWINQFANLLNVASNKIPTRESDVGRQIKTHLKEQALLAQRPKA